MHFDTYKNVKRLKKIAAIQQKARRQLRRSHDVTLESTDKIWSDEDSTDESSDKETNEERSGNGAVETNENTNKVIPKTTNKVVEKDLYSPLPLHCRETLSQFYYHTKLQKPKQVVTRHFQERWPQEDPLTLMVDQLWMLILVDGRYSVQMHRDLNSRLTCQVQSLHAFRARCVAFNESFRISTLMLWRNCWDNFATNGDRLLPLSLTWVL